MAAFDLLGDFNGLLISKSYEPCVLSTLKFMVKRSDKLTKKYGLPVTERVLEFLVNAKEISEQPGSQVYPILAACNDIDSGEVVIFDAAYSNLNSIIATGDKRCLKALSRSEECSFISDAIKGRVYCLEHIIHDIIMIGDFESIKSRIVPSRECDTALKAVFGSGMDCQRPMVMASLLNYRQHLYRDTGEVLLPVAGA
jgi:hypothetical protein